MYNPRHMTDTQLMNAHQNLIDGSPSSGYEALQHNKMLDRINEELALREEERMEAVRREREATRRYEESNRSENIAFEELSDEEKDQILFEYFQNEVELRSKVMTDLELIDFIESLEYATERHKLLLITMYTDYEIK